MFLSSSETLPTHACDAQRLVFTCSRAKTNDLTQILCTQIARHVTMLAAGYLFSLCICSRVVSVQNGPGSTRSRDAVW